MTGVSQSRDGGDMSKKFTVWFSFVFFICVASGFYFWRNHTHPISINPLPRVSVEPVSIHSIPLTVSAVGTVLAPKSVTLMTQQSGLVKKCLFSAGSLVKKGQLLLQQDDHVQRFAWLQAAADYQAKLKNYQRQLQLQKSSPGAISKSDLTTTKSSVEVARALMQSKLLALRDTKIHAPFSGVIEPLLRSSSASVNSSESSETMLPNVGSYFTSQQSFARLIDSHHVLIAYAVPVLWRTQLKIGQTVRVNVPGSEVSVVIGQVTYIAPELDVSNQTIQIQVQLPVCAACVPGLRVPVEHVIDATRQVLAVPGLSLVPSVNGYSVYEVRHGRVASVPVSIGERHGGWVVVSHGLKSGDRIITSGLQAVSAGNLVKVV
jgi:multidrug efflux pump subunit AcrA (membrane-fusion protein)